MANAQQLAAEAAAQIRDQLGATFDAAVVLGSGWAEAVDELGTTEAQVSADTLAGFASTRVAGHAGTIAAIAAGDRRLLVFRGRVHLYEVNDANAVVHGVRTAARLGCGMVIMTNAAGGIRFGYRVGEPVVISDHLNLTGESPVAGAEWGDDRFVNLLHAYSPRLRSIAAQVSPTSPQGVYAGLRGPHFETPAEIGMLRTLGADMVGMSTVLECIAARQCDMEVLGVSLVTNMAAGMVTDGPSHQEVLDTGAAAGVTIGQLLRGVIDLS